jgi:NMD protein affecting ribosome stability and mRNA decay
MRYYGIIQPRVNVYVDLTWDETMKCGAHVGQDDGSIVELCDDCANEHDADLQWAAQGDEYVTCAKCGRQNPPD